MLLRLPLAAAALVLAGAVAGCATTAGDTAEAKPEKVYRTGSNLPVRDPSQASEVKQVKVEDHPATRMQMPSPAAFGK